MVVVAGIDEFVEPFIKLHSIRRGNLFCYMGMHKPRVLLFSDRKAKIEGLYQGILVCPRCLDIKKANCAASAYSSLTEIQLKLGFL